MRFTRIFDLRTVLFAFLLMCGSAPASALDTSQGKAIVTTMADGLEQPWSFGFLADGSVLITERGGVAPKEELVRNMPAGHQPSLICIEDPLDHGNDVGRSSYGAPLVIRAFEHGYVQLAGLVRKDAQPNGDGRR